MKQGVYAVYDSKACAFGLPFYVPVDQQAIRMFGDAVLDSTTVMCKHPDDFKLYKLADYDCVSGSFVVIAQPLYLACGADFHGISVAKKGEV